MNHGYDYDYDYDMDGCMAIHVWSACDSDINCLGLGLGLGSSKGEGQRPLPPAWGASWEHLIGHCVIQNAGLDGPFFFLVRPSRAPLTFLRTPVITFVAMIQQQSTEWCADTRLLSRCVRKWPPGPWKRHVTFHHFTEGKGCTSRFAQN